MSGSLCPYLFLVTFRGLFSFWLFCPFLLEACSFSNEGQEEGGSRREGIEEELVEGESRIRIYCIRNGMFSIKGKNTKVMRKFSSLLTRNRECKSK